MSDNILRPVSPSFDISAFASSAVGIMAWWSLTFASFTTCAALTGTVAPALMNAAAVYTNAGSPAAMSDVINLLSVRGYVNNLLS